MNSNQRARRSLLPGFLVLGLLCLVGRAGGIYWLTGKAGRSAYIGTRTQIQAISILSLNVLFSFPSSDCCSGVFLIGKFAMLTREARAFENGLCFIVVRRGVLRFSSFQPRSIFRGKANSCCPTPHRRIG